MHQSNHQQNPQGYDHPNHPLNQARLSGNQWQGQSSPPQPPAPSKDVNATRGQDKKPWEDMMRLKVFGGKSALEFYETQTRSKQGSGWHTVQVDAAFKIQGREEYDWQKKSVVQITRLELPVFIAVMLGLRAQCSFHSHGPNKDKGFEIIRQPDKGSVFFKVFEGKGNTKAVPIPMVDAIMIGHMALAQYLVNFDGRISSDVVMNSLHALPE